MKIETLWDLPGSALPKPDSLVGPIFVSIWLGTLFGLAAIFHRLLTKPSPTWPEFHTIALGTRLLTL